MRFWMKYPEIASVPPSSTKSFQVSASRAACVLPEREVAARNYDSGCTGETQGTLEKKHTVEQGVEEKAGHMHTELIITVAL